MSSHFLNALVLIIHIASILNVVRVMQVTVHKVALDRHIRIVRSTSTYCSVSVFGREVYKTRVFRVQGRRKLSIFRERFLFYDVRCLLVANL